MTVFLRVSLVAVGIAGFAASAHAAAPADVPACPQELSVSETPKDVPAGWSATVLGERHHFENVQFSEGDPKDQVFLAPGRTRKAGNRMTSTWEFGPSTIGYWLSCGYGSTLQGLTRKLPAGIASCSVEYDASYAVPVATRFSCTVQ